MVKGRLQARDGFLEGFDAAEMPGGDLGGAAKAVEGLHLHQLGQGVELDDAALDVLVEQQREDFAGRIAVLAKQILRCLSGLFRTLAAEGISLVILSSEIEEILLLCQRVLVFREQARAAELSGSAMTTDSVIAAMFGRLEKAQ